MNSQKLASKYSPSLRKAIENPYTSPWLKQSLKSLIVNQEPLLKEID